MTTYNTGNPIGSKDPRDLYDNAENLDRAVNSTAATWTDRFGVSRLTAAGVINEATVQTGAYATEALGRGAVADGETFRVQGSGGIASYEYRRVNASSSTLIATYPSHNAIADIGGAASAINQNIYTNIISSLFSRGNANTGKDLTNASFCGWKSSFKHNGDAFDCVRFTFKTNIVKPIRVEVQTATGDVIAYGFVVPKTTLQKYAAVLNKTVTELANGDIGYIAYYDPSFTVDVGYPAGQTNRAPGDADVSIYPSYIKYKSNPTTWSQASAGTAWDILFDVINTKNYASILDQYLTVSSGPYAKVESDNFIKTAAIKYLQYQNPNVPTEYDGSRNYGGTGIIIGHYQKVEVDTVFNAIKMRLWVNDSSADVEYKIWVANALTGFNMQSTATAASGIIPAGEIGTVNALFTLRIGTLVKVPKNYYAIVMFRSTSTVNSGVVRRLFNYDPAIVPVRQGFPYCVSSSWNANISYAGTGYNFDATAADLLLESEEFNLRLDEINSGALVETGEIILPLNIFATTGRECNVYLDNIVPDAASNYNFDVTTSGVTGDKHQNERWTFIPTGAVSAGSLSISLHSARSENAITSKTATIRAAASSAGSGVTKKVLVIGDSLINAGAITQTLLDIAGTDAMKIALYGTLGTAPNLREGRGGWTYYTYTVYNVYSVDNAFWFGGESGAFDFSQYISSNGFPAMDWVFIQLGTNEMLGVNSDSSVASSFILTKPRIDIMINSIKAQNANTKVALAIPPPPSADQDSFGENYGANAPRWRYKRNILLWAKQLIATYGGQEANRIYIAPSNTAIDSVHNMIMGESSPVNSRQPDILIKRQANGVHPATPGYQQIADSWWAMMKYYA